MATYRDTVTQDSSYDFNIFGYTDVNNYVDWSTYIDFWHGWDETNQKIYTGTHVDYTLALEFYNKTKKYWVAKKLHTGYFRYGVTTRFTLSGLPAGSYRIRGYYTYGGKTHINRTSAFTVKR